MELSRILRSVKYLNVAEIESVEKAIKARKDEFNKMVIRQGDTVELSYSEDHMMRKMDGENVKVESINGERYITKIGGNQFAFPKSRVKRIVKKGRNK